MASPSPSLIAQAKQLWIRLNPRQRLMIGGGTLGAVALIGFMVHTMSTPEYKPLMVGLEAADAQAISADLAAKKIAYELSADGKSINVAADQLDAARLEIASQGAPHSGRMGFELFDKLSWGQTEFDEKVNYQRALEGELERTIQTLGDVKSARVHLVLSRASVFLDRERGAKASVTLRLKHGNLSSEKLDAISRLVAGAVENLDPGDVAIIDADSNQNLSRRRGSAGDAAELEQQLSTRLLATLGPAVGVDNLRASVNVEYDLSSSEENQDKYDPDVSAVLTTQKSQEQTGAGAAAEGVAGTTSNLPADPQASQAAGPDDGGQSSSSENSTFGVNKLARHTVTPAGRIRRITAALLINDLVERKLVKNKWVETPHKRSAADLKQLSDLAGAVIGLDSSRGDVISVQNMSFDSMNTADGPVPTVLERVRTGVSDYSGVVRYAGLLALFVLIWALMLRPVQNQIVASVKELAAGGGAAAALPQSAASPTAIGADPATLKTQLAELVHAEPVAMTRTVQAWLREERP